MEGGLDEASPRERSTASARSEPLPPEEYDERCPACQQVGHANKFRFWKEQGVWIWHCHYEAPYEEALRHMTERSRRHLLDTLKRPIPPFNPSKPKLPIFLDHAEPEKRERRLSLGSTENKPRKKKKKKKDKARSSHVLRPEETYFCGHLWCPAKPQSLCPTCGHECIINVHMNHLMYWCNHCYVFSQ